MLRFRIVFALLGLLALVFGAGCSGASEEESDASEEELNRFFDGPVIAKLVTLSNDIDSALRARARVEACTRRLRLGAVSSSLRRAKLRVPREWLGPRWQGR